MAGGYYFPKGRRTGRVWISWNGKKIWINKYLDGTPIYHEEQAKRVLEKIRGEIDQKIFDPMVWGKDKTLLFENAWEIYQKEVKVGAERENQRESIFEKYLSPYFKGKSIREITSVHVNEWYQGVSQHGFSAGYLRLIIVTLKAFFHFNRDSLIRMPRFPVSKLSPKEIIWLARDQQLKVHEFISPWHTPIFDFIMITGCRPSEACNLKRTDIDRVRGIFAFKDTKTRSITSLPITPEIDKTFAFRGNVEHLERVFFTSRGNKYLRQTLDKIWSNANKEANKVHGIPVVNLYTGNRHSFARQRANEGYQMELISKVLGHSSTRTTEKYYVRYKTDKLKPLLSQIAQNGPYKG